MGDVGDGGYEDKKGEKFDDDDDNNNDDGYGNNCPEDRKVIMIQ